MRCVMALRTSIYTMICSNQNSIFVVTTSWYSGKTRSRARLFLYDDFERELAELVIEGSPTKLDPSGDEIFKQQYRN